MRPHAREPSHERRSGRLPTLVAGFAALSTVLAISSAMAAPLAPRALTPPPPRAKAAAHHHPQTHRSARPKPVFAVCPVDRPRIYFAGDFGSARYAGGYHRHQGDDILAPFGTKIRAPFDGVATPHSNWAGGLAVYVYGRKGFVYNAHLSRLGRLGRVKAGTVIGYVGNSGDASGGAAHDHFEWHPGGGPAVNPYPYLQQACTGRHQWHPRARGRRLSHWRFLLAKQE